jgi:hypothetical protein
MLERLYAPPRDRLLLASNDTRVFELAERLWERTEGEASAPIRVAVDVREGPAPPPLAERGLAWRLAPDVFTVSLGTLLEARIQLLEGVVTAHVSEGLLRETPELAARYALEAPTAALLARRGFAVLHAGAVAGTRGAVVIRGASGAGKSTLVAAAWKAGLSVLGDESVLAAREAPDELASSVRDLTVRHDSDRLLRLPGTSVAWSGDEEKMRVELLTRSSPRARRATRTATFLLGQREPGPARLTALGPDEFLEEFRRGEIPEEIAAAGIAIDWSLRSVFRLDGASDLSGAVALVMRYAGPPEEPEAANGGA